MIVSSSPFYFDFLTKNSFRENISTESRPISWFIESWENGKLNPPLHREEFTSWTKKQKQDLILSLFRGEHTQHLTTSLHEDGEYIILDGYQRLQAILEFTKSKFPLLFNGIKIWFHPKGKYHLAPEERKCFLHSTFLSSIVYFNLSAEKEISKYNRIQHCVKK